LSRGKSSGIDKARFANADRPFENNVPASFKAGA
jgi:hypothetical protein